MSWESLTYSLGPLPEYVHTEDTHTQSYAFQKWSKEAQLENQQ